MENRIGTFCETCRMPYCICESKPMNNDEIRMRKIETVNRFGMPQMDSKNVYLFGCTMFDSGYILATENHTKELKRLNDLLYKPKNSIKERAKKVPKWIKFKVAIRMFFNKLLQKYK
jgi:ribosomal protein L17